MELNPTLLALLCLALAATHQQAEGRAFPKETAKPNWDLGNGLSLVEAASKMKMQDLVMHYQSSDATLKSEIEGLAGGITCDVCEVAATTLQDLIVSNASEDFIVKVAIDICIGLDVEDDRVCHGIIHEFKDEFIGVIADVALAPKEICGVLLGNSCATTHNPWNENWTIPLINTTKPAYTPPAHPKQGAPVTTVLHLSDIHYDAKYAAGSSVTCKEPVCCRSWLGSGKAGHYGALGDCDSPLALLENLLQHVSQTVPDLKYVIFTGDVPAHNVWNQSRDDIIKSIDDVSDLFSKYLPNTKVYPALGNHESAPVNSFPPPYVTGYNAHSWLLNTLAKDWGRWLPESTQATIKLGGFYSVELETGLRLISLNINYCNPLNWWLLINNTDPVGQLQWFQEQLQDAENKNEKAYIIGHIPPRGGCLKAWSWVYHKIADRYANIIRGQFFGHYHSDEEAIFYDEDDTSLPTGVWYIGPSVTTYMGGSGTFPSYRIYEKDGDYVASSHAVLDHSTHILNLTEVDRTSLPLWTHEYSAKSAYGMASLNPSEWDRLATRMLTNDTLVQRYSQYRGHSAHVGHCDTGCRNSLLCNLKTTRADDDSHCQDLLASEEDKHRYQQLQAETLSNC